MRVDVPTIDADFEAGNVDVVDVAPDHIRFRAAARGSPRPLWFYFRLRGVRGRQLRLTISNVRECLGHPSAWNTVRPVASYDQHAWFRLPRTEYREEAGTFTVAHTFTSDTAWVAHCYPYTYTDLTRYLDTLRDRPGVQVSTLTKSAEGRDVPLVVLDGDDVRQDAPGVWIVARQHAGETPPSFVLEGLLDYLTGASATAARYRRALRVAVVPLVDVDSAVAGRYGKDRGPVDFWLDWSEAPTRPEIRAAQQAIAAWAATRRYNLFLDLHAPTPWDVHHFYAMPDAAVPPRLRSLQARFLQLVELLSPPMSQYHRTDTHPGFFELDHNAQRHQFRRHGVLSLTFELSYHLARTEGDSLAYVSPTSLRALGAGLARAIGELFA